MAATWSSSHDETTYAAATLKTLRRFSLPRKRSPDAI
jgi:hypothetical protein